LPNIAHFNGLFKEQVLGFICQVIAILPYFGFFVYYLCPSSLLDLPCSFSIFIVQFMQLQGSFSTNHPALPAVSWPLHHMSLKLNLIHWVKPLQAYFAFKIVPWP
jgi:hypothetical protein